MIIVAPQASFNRPSGTTQYADGDLVADNGTAGSVTPLKFSMNGIGRSGIIRRARLYKSATSATAASFALHLFDKAPTVANGDNGAFSIATNIDSWLGKIAIDMSSGSEAGASAGLSQVSAAVAIPVSKNVAGGIIYGLIEANGTYTPASQETFTAHLEIEG